jgi:SagB-type dehydrogenase family enzyme
MKNIPHDYYLKFTHAEVIDEVLNFHTKGNFIIHDSVKNIAQLHQLSVQDLHNLTGNELQLYPDLDITLNDIEIGSFDETSPLHRNPSCNYFKDAATPFDKVLELLSPLTSKSSTAHNRGYPSAGALYPVEVFCCSLNTQNDWPSGDKILHLLPNSKKFEVVQNNFDTDKLKKSILPLAHGIGTPSLAIIYVIHMPKILFKYRYRGYRLAMMEAGSMYMLVDLHSKKLHLKSRQWSGFSDNMLCKSIGLNPTLFYPACVHLIGK